MPITFESTPETGSLATLKIYTPKFFNSVLTGSGKSIGTLCDALNPAALGYHPNTTTEHVNCKKEHYTNGNTKVNKIPVNTLTARAWNNIRSVKLPDKFDMSVMTQTVTSKNGVPVEFYTVMKPHSIIIEETDNSAQNNTNANANAGNAKGAGKTKKTTACYQIFVYAVSDWSEPFVSMKHGTDDKACLQILMDFADTMKQSALPEEKNACYYCYVCDAVDKYKEILTDMENHGYKPDRQSMVDYLNNYSIYDAMVKRSEEWQMTVSKTLNGLFENIAKHMIPANAVFQKFNSNGQVVQYTGDTLEALETMSEELEYIETYPIPLDLYREIYDSLCKNFHSSFRIEFCKHNLNLLLSDTLYSLNGKKSNLSQIVLPANPKPPIGPNGTIYSPEQARAITCTDPLVLIQAGAGTGKSTTILARVNWMLDNGISPKDIMIISFTNAAADNIMTKNPYIQSMTIAKMIHTIYENNFPTHELSTPETLSNTLDIYFPNDPIANQFRKRVEEMREDHSRGNDIGRAYTQMNNFVERNLDDVIRLLDGVKQSTLALEIIICYQMIDRLQEPPEIASKFLIIDEVQDNSVFEFIYALKYVDKHNEAMLIVGDCSQTLYEFRASNPKALNVLEGSDVFTTHKLQINYRSNQEILDFANVLLENIEANQYARIQLQANSLRTVTEQSFLDAVKFQYHRCVKQEDIKEDLPAIIRTCIKPFVDACLAAKEQVAFLAYKRADLQPIEEELHKLYPNLTIANITSPRSKASTLFSRYIQKNWSTLTFAPSQNLLNIIVTSIQAQLSQMVVNPKQTAQWAAKAGAQQLYDWQVECGQTIGEWQRQFNAGQITKDQFMDFMKENMLQYEIKRNATKQAMLSSKKRDKAFNDMVQNAEILVSTVHGAKGLEFPHVVLLFNAKKGMSEEDKRMYYVGLTRAMKSEYILAFNNIPSPKVQADYETIIKQLHQRYPAGQVPAIPLVTGVPSKNKLSINLDVLEQGVIPLTPGIMPECVIADPSDPIGAQRELDARRAQSQFTANGMAAARAQVMAQAVANGQVFDPATGTVTNLPAENESAAPVQPNYTPNTAQPANPGMPGTPPVPPARTNTFAPTVNPVQQPTAPVANTTYFANTGRTVNPVIPNATPNYINPVTLAKPPVTPGPVRSAPSIMQNPAAYGEMLKRMQSGNPANPNA